MNGVHDLGGMHGFGPVIREPNEPVFHSDWEKRVFAMTLTAMGRRVCNVDEFRRAIERMPPPKYLAASYYEKWLHALESLLIEKGVVTPEELASGHAAAPVAVKSTAPLDRGGDGDDGGVDSFDSSAVKLRFDKSFKPAFRVGDRVIARNLNPEHHTRLPRYARGKRGVIRYDQGVFVFPDTHAHGQGGKPQHVYTVAFDGKELWGADCNHRAPVYLDCWEDYLVRDRAAAKPSAPVKMAGKSSGGGRGSAVTVRAATKLRASKRAQKRSAPSRAAAGKGRKR